MKTGFVGWRGMVGSVLMQRMREEQDFARLGEAVFFSTSQAGQPAPELAGADALTRGRKRSRRTGRLRRDRELPGR